MKWHTFSSVAVLTLLLPTSAYALQNEFNNSSGSFGFAQVSQHSPERRFDKGDRAQRWLQQLDLTPEQSQQIQTIQEQARTQSEDLRQQLQEARSQMQSLFASDTTAEELRQQRDALQNLQQELGDRRFETMLEIREILTPEQRTQLAELKPQRRGRGSRLDE